MPTQRAAAAHLSRRSAARLAGPASLLAALTLHAALLGGLGGTGGWQGRGGAGRWAAQPAPHPANRATPLPLAVRLAQAPRRDNAPALAIASQGPGTPAPLDASASSMPPDAESGLAEGQGADGLPGPGLSQDEGDYRGPARPASPEPGEARPPDAADAIADATAPAKPAAHPPAGAAPAGASTELQAFPADLYAPRSALSLAPRPTAALVVPFPPVGVPDGQYSAVLALFIDETGQVQRVRVESQGLPAALEEEARRTFMAARFSPGEIGGQPVKSVLRIEVAFESRTPAAAR